MQGKIYLDVPFGQKEEAKSLGARWDTHIKKWYYDGPINDFVKFGKWIISEDSDEAIIVHENFCIIEAKRVCYKCNQETTIIGFGIWDHSILTEDNGVYRIENSQDDPEMEDEIHLAWSDNESEIPPLLLTYIKSKYSVKTGYSKKVGECFANHCDHCGSIQGNNYLFEEDSNLSTSTPEDAELIERMSKLKIYNVYIDSSLVLNWGIGYCSNDWAYVQYGPRFTDLEFPECEDMYISYEKMYQIK